MAGKRRTNVGSCLLAANPVGQDRRGLGSIPSATPPSTEAGGWPAPCIEELVYLASEFCAEAEGQADQAKNRQGSESELVQRLVLLTRPDGRACSVRPPTGDELRSRRRSDSGWCARMQNRGVPYMGVTGPWVLSHRRGAAKLLSCHRTTQSGPDWGPTSNTLAGAHCHRAAARQLAL